MREDRRLQKDYNKSPQDRIGHTPTGVFRHHPSQELSGLKPSMYYHVNRASPVEVTLSLSALKKCLKILTKSKEVTCEPERSDRNA